jgi:CheY-like chemotaxis protein
MPEMDGWLAAQKLKSNEATKSIPLYALSAHTLPNERKRAIQAGCDGYVTKPIYVEGFLALIESALVGKKARRAARTTGSLNL